MQEKEFENFLHMNIPLTEIMGLTVEKFTTSKVVLKAKLEPNINDKGTAFGGSISSLLTICGWAMAFINIKELDPSCQVVIHKSSISYHAPIVKDFTAECILEDEAARNEFINSYLNRGKSRIKLYAKCCDGNKLLVDFEGYYVAINKV